MSVSSTSSGISENSIDSAEGNYNSFIVSFLIVKNKVNFQVRNRVDHTHFLGTF